jgi:ABC-type sugar transport system ATPase subunit
MQVRLDRVSKSFGSNRVLHEIGLVFPSRYFVTLLGPSGCGKTTLLRLIAGLERISSGSIWFGDRRVDYFAPRDRNIAMVFQNYALYPHMTVMSNIGYALKVRGMKAGEVRGRVQPVAKVLEIVHLLMRKPRQLSGGQRQRVALGRAMVRKPDIFLMDEPLSNLDAKLRVTMRAELKRFHMDLGTTTIYVTHDQLEAMTMSDIIAVINEGGVQQFATPAEIYSRPANLFVAGFVGSPPMNFVEGTLSRLDGAFLVTPHFRVRLPSAFSAALDRLGEGERLVLGIRPQDIALVAGTADSIPGRVWLVELLGSEKLVDIETGPKQRFTVQVRADSLVAIDQTVGLLFDPMKIHVFLPDTGAALPRAVA